MRLGKKVLASLVTASMLLSLTSGAALAGANEMLDAEEAAESSSEVPDTVVPLESTPDSNVESDPESDPEGEADPEADPEEEAEPEADPEEEAEPEADAEAYPEAAVDSEPEADAAPAATADRLTVEAEADMVPSDEALARPSTRQYMVELEEPSGAEVLMEAKERGLMAADVSRTTKQHQDKLEQTQRNIIRAIERTRSANTKVLYQVKNVLNGIAVQTDEATAEQIRNMPGVKAVTMMELHERNNAYTVPLIGSPEAWKSYGVVGEGIKVAVIDSGIDYLHTNFGGPGTPEAYELDTTTLNEFYPNAKVVGGWDFVGDAYRGGGTTPRPDPNPLDCKFELGGGHGTHVAGTIAGYGVNADGTTYTGPYDDTVPFGTMRIGPGVAPLAELYSLRVFGCEGSTGMTVAALDWVVDPNGDGDYSDRMDIANLSLGSSFGTAEDPSARAANNAALAGVLLAIASGNSGDVYYVSGSPGSATRALTVAGQSDAVDVGDGFRIDAPGVSQLYGGTVGQSYNWSTMAEPVTAPVVYTPDNPAGCNAWPAGSLAGKIALVDWVPEGLTDFPCGSAVRANNATSAGAVGIIMAEPGPFLTVAIAGNAAIPSILTTSTAYEAIQSELDNGVTATLSNEWLGSVKIVAPDRDDTVYESSSRGPSKGNALKPDIAAPAVSIFSPQSGSGSAGVSFNGTSMATPHMAGVLALLREKNPSWSVEEVKALAMNTSGNDIYSGLGRTGDRYNQSRVGAGRVNVAAAVENQVVAFNADHAGAVSVSFGAVEVLGSATFERTVRVVNHSGSTVTYSPSIDMMSEIPGLAYTFPDGDVTVQAGRSVTFRVRLDADASQMLATHDPTVSEIQNGFVRQWIPEHSGVILLKPVTSSPGAEATLRVPVYVTARPAADVSTAEDSISFAGDTGVGLLNMTGTGLATGGFSNVDYNALVTPFELAHVGGVANLDKDAGIQPAAIPAVVQYAGVTTDSKAVRALGGALSDSELYFGIAAHADWSTPANEVYYEVQVRPKGHNGTPYYVYNTRNAVQSGGGIDYFDVMLACVSPGCYTNTNGMNSNLQSGVFNNNVMIFPVPVDYLGLDDDTTEFEWRVVTEHYNFGIVDITPWYEYDYANPGLDFTGGFDGQPTYLAEPGKSLGVAYDKAAYEAANSKGILLLHNFNASGNRAQVVGVNSTPAVFAFTDAPDSKTYGDEPFDLTVTNEAATIGSLTQAICTVGPTVNGVATVTPLVAGDCVVRAQFAGDDTAAPAFVDATIAISKAELVVTPNAVTRAFGQANPELTGTVTGLVAADESQLTFQYSTTATAESPAGTYPITVKIIDNKGLLPNYNVTINEANLTILDESAPTIAATVTPEANEAGWHNTDVVVSFQCDDPESGIAECSDPVTLTEDGKNQTVTGYALSNTGIRAETTVTVNIDKTAPNWAANSQLTASQVTSTSMKLNWNGASDTLSGISHYEVYDGDTLLETVLGTSVSLDGLSPDTDYSLSVVVVDKAGNAADGPSTSVRTGGLSFLGVLGGGDDITLPETGFDIEFQWLVNGVETENPSATVRIVNAETGSLITSFLMARGITYEDGIYELPFDPQQFGLGAGDQVTIQVYVGRKLQNSVTITLE